MECRVGVATRNPVKIRAVQRVFRLLCTPVVTPVDYTPSVGGQPVGLCSLLRGALERAEAALEAGDYGVGIEAGFIDVYGIPVELQVAVIVDRGKRVSVGFSSGFMLPGSWARELLEKRVELGSIASAATGRRDIGRRMGLIGYLTHGLVSRTDLSSEAVLMAILPFVNSTVYGDLPRLDAVKERLKTCTS